MYTNVDRIISSKLELQDYLQEKKPMIVCLTETKLNEVIQIVFDKKTMYGGKIEWAKVVEE